MALPRQPSERRPYPIRCHLFRAWSRSAARSGMSPMYQNTSEIVKYVVTANTSQVSGDRNCGYMPAMLGNG